MVGAFRLISKKWAGQKASLESFAPQKTCVSNGIRWNVTHLWNALGRKPNRFGSSLPCGVVVWRRVMVKSLMGNHLQSSQWFWFAIRDDMVMRFVVKPFRSLPEMLLLISNPSTLSICFLPRNGSQSDYSYYLPSISSSDLIFFKKECHCFATHWEDGNFLRMTEVNFNLKNCTHRIRFLHHRSILFPLQNLKKAREAFFLLHFNSPTLHSTHNCWQTSHSYFHHEKCLFNYCHLSSCDLRSTSNRLWVNGEASEATEVNNTQ